jgi:hypothetical protein
MKVKINKAQYLVDRYAKVETLSYQGGPIEIFLRKGKHHIGWAELKFDMKEIILIERNK